LTATFPRATRSDAFVCWLLSMWSRSRHPLYFANGFYLSPFLFLYQRRFSLDVPSPVLSNCVIVFKVFLPLSPALKRSPFLRHRLGFTKSLKKTEAPVFQPPPPFCPRTLPPYQESSGPLAAFVVLCKRRLLSPAPLGSAAR